MDSKLLDLLKNEDLVKKIIYYYEFHNKKTSSSFLMHKFKLNSYVSGKVMEIVTAYEKENGIQHPSPTKKKKFKIPLDKVEKPSDYIRKIHTSMELHK